MCGVGCGVWGVVCVCVCWIIKIGWWMGWKGVGWSGAGWVSGCEGRWVGALFGWVGEGCGVWSVEVASILFLKVLKT